MKKFEDIIWAYYKKHKRDLPWRHTTDPYKILVSEIMLQQTQVVRIIPKYKSFLKIFPTFYSLANASLNDLLREWKGIGYNRRVLYLKRIAEIVVEQYGGVLPDDPQLLEHFPGIGPATARSIVVYTFNKPYAFIETNVRKIYIHHFFHDKTDIDDKELLPLIEKTMDRKRPREWYWALMDYGSWLATVVPNPNKKSKHYSRQSKFIGSLRQLRGNMLNTLVKQGAISRETLLKEFKDKRAVAVLEALQKEGFVKMKGKRYTIT